MVARLRLRKEKPALVAQPETGQETLKVQRLRRLTALLKKSNVSSYDPPPPPISSHPTPPNEIFTSDKHEHCDDASLVTMSTWASYSTMRTLTVLQQEAQLESSSEVVDQKAKPVRGEINKVVETETLPTKAEKELKPSPRATNEELKPIPGKIVGKSPPTEMIVRILPIGERSNSEIQNQRQDKEEEKQRETDDLMESCVRAAFQTAIDEAEKIQAPPTEKTSPVVVTSEIIPYAPSPCHSVASAPTTKSLTKSQVASNALFRRILRWMVVYGGSHQKDASKRLLAKAESLGPVEPSTAAAGGGNSFWKLHPDIMLDPGWHVMENMLDAAGIDITDKASLEVFLQSYPPPSPAKNKKTAKQQEDPFDKPILEDPFLDDIIAYCTVEICQFPITGGRTI